MTIKLDQFSPESLHSTKNHWLSIANENELPVSDYEKIIEWAERRIDYTALNGESYAYGIFDDEYQECLAVVDIVYTRNRGGWLKMLTVNLSPLFAPVCLAQDASKIERVIDIYAVAALGTIELTNVHISATVKLYGRNDAMLVLLSALKNKIDSTPDLHLIAKLDGRWLNITGR